MEVRFRAPNSRSSVRDLFLQSCNVLLFFSREAAQFQVYGEREAIEFVEMG